MKKGENMTQDKRRKYYEDNLCTLQNSMFKKNYKISPISHVMDTIEQIQDMKIYNTQNTQPQMNSIFMLNNSSASFNNIQRSNYLMA